MGEKKEPENRTDGGVVARYVQHTGETEKRQGTEERFIENMKRRDIQSLIEPREAPCVGKRPHTRGVALRRKWLEPNTLQVAYTS